MVCSCVGQQNPITDLLTDKRDDLLLASASKQSSSSSSPISWVATECAYMAVCVCVCVCLPLGFLDGRSIDIPCV